MIKLVIQQDSITLAAFMFLDDIVLIRMAPTNDTPSHMEEEGIQEGEGAWKEALEFTGGCAKNIKVLIITAIT